jgi:hypothetical protein
MLPHQGYSRPENPKRHGFDSSIKLSPLQNYGIMNLQNHGLKDSAVRNIFRKIKNSAITLEKILRMVSNVHSNFSRPILHQSGLPPAEYAPQRFCRGHV